MTVPTNPKQTMRPIRSFVKREGKLTTGQQKAIDTLFPTLGVDGSVGTIDFDMLFGRKAAVILEIGFGNGVSLAEMAQANPEQNFFGIEVHKPGLGSLLVQVSKHQLHNVHVSNEDAVNVIEQQIANSCLRRIQLFFPDPWHKKRHHKRRLIQPGFVAQLVNKLVAGGELHIATDWHNYAEHIIEVLMAENRLQNSAQDNLYSDKPDYRPLTKYEQRGLNLGHDVWDIIFKKRVDDE